jgi:acetylornithine/succinyldiaminopimelate/putrescine aminotransferase
MTDLMETTMETPSGTAPTLAGEETFLFAPLYPLPRLELASGRGSWAWDAGGRKYLDFTCGIAVNALGHAPRGLSRVVANQMGRLGHSSNLFAHRPGIELARALTRTTGYDKVFFCNSGAEGMDAAMKIARARAGALGLAGRDILAFRGGFHGRTGFAVSATWTPAYREPFEPLVPGIRFADYNDLGALDAGLDANVCAVVVELVQGEGGAVPARPEFLRALRERTTAIGAALILDEVQTGMGRTGTLLAAEQFGLKGEMTVMSKALGSGFPVAAVLMTDETAATLKPGMHGSTFGGGAPACAAALWTLDRIGRPSFLARVRRRAQTLERGLAKLAEKHASVTEARGLGLLRAVELAPGFEPPRLVALAREQGLLLVRGGDRAVRMLPPLVVSPSELTEGLERLDAALTALEAEKGSASS